MSTELVMDSYLFVPQRPLIPTPGDWIWLAGFVDGEGSIGINRERDKRKGPDYFSYRASLQIAQTTRGVLDDAREICNGGAVTEVATANERQARQFHYQLRKRGSLFAALEQLIPYLRVKRPHAQLR